MYGIRRVIAWRYKRENEKPKTIEFRIMKKYNSTLLLQDLKQIDGKTILDPLSDDPSGMADTFQKYLNQLQIFMLRLKKEGTNRVRSLVNPEASETYED